MVLLDQILPLNVGDFGNLIYRISPHPITLSTISRSLIPAPLLRVPDDCICSFQVSTPQGMKQDIPFEVIRRAMTPI